MDYLAQDTPLFDTMNEGFDAEIVILDEATAAMDNLTEEAVMREVIHILKERTVIAVAHRLSSVSDFDRIVVFHRGEIVGDGTFEELIHSNPFFADLYSKGNTSHLHTDAKDEKYTFEGKR